MRNIFNFLRFRRQAPTEKPPKGYYDLRVSKSTGNLVMVDEDGTETVIGGSDVTSVAGRTGAVVLVQADIGGLTTESSPDFSGLGVTGATTFSDTVTCEAPILLDSYTQLSEISEPAAVANKALLYAKDNGGKTELLVIFPTGSAQQLAIEA